MTHGNLLQCFGFCVERPKNFAARRITVRMQNDKSARGIQSIEKAAEAQVNAAYFDKYDPPKPSEEDADMDSD